MTKKNITADREIEDFLRALASGNRRNILFLFVDGKERTVGEIASAAGLGQSTASEQLAILKRASLLVSRKEGKEVFYRPDRVSISRILRRFSDMLLSCC